MFSHYVHIHHMMDIGLVWGIVMEPKITPGKNIRKKENSGFVSLLFSHLFTGKKKNLEITDYDAIDAQELFQQMKNARKDWQIANMNFEFAKEQEIIDYYTYEIKAAETKMIYLIKQMKQKGYKMEIDEIMGPYFGKIDAGLSDNT